jgi:hypothetical protein
LVYEILTKTDLTASNWNIEEEVWPTNPVAMPFVIQQLGRTNLFVWARDWTGVTEGTNTIPSWWFWKYFGTTSLSDTNLDSQGPTLLYDYQNYIGENPNVISFTIAITNNYLITNLPEVQLSLTGGFPSGMAVSVDDTNFIADASWQPYTGTNLTLNLGSAQGWHSVWIGLRGSPMVPPTWQWERFKLDTTPPQIVVTNPASVVSQSLIQLAGYCPEALSRISYDLSNTNGAVTNQQVLILNQHYDTNHFELTTNTFQAFDIWLAGGTNIFTIHATDLAGNMSSTNLSVVLVSDTNAPVINLVWPQNGMDVSGTNFTIFGTTDDPSATITATVTDSYGDTNTYTALMERNGNFWFENLPLTNGTTTVTLNAVDIWGNASATNFSVNQSSLNLILNPVYTSLLYGPAVNLTGTVSDSNVVSG